MAFENNAKFWRPSDCPFFMLNALLPAVLILFSSLTIFSSELQAQSKAKRKSPVYAAYILDDATGKVFHKTNANTVTHPASLTKVMTLYMLFEALKSKKVTLNTKMKVSKHASRQKPSKLWLKPGSTLKVRDAVMALTVKSANDVAVVVAEHLGGTEAKFAQMMTKKARQLGAKNTTYKTASGLPNKREITTARDQTIIFRALYRHFPSYWRYFKHKSFTFRGQKHPTHSRILNMCPGVDGLKTGFINASGFNLVISAKRENARLFAVVMGGQTSKWRDKRMTNLMNRYFPKAIKLNKDLKPKSKTNSKTAKFIQFASNMAIPEKPAYNGPLTQQPVLVAQKDTITTPTQTKTEAQSNGPTYHEPDAIFQAALNQKPGRDISEAEDTNTPESIDDIITAEESISDDANPTPTELTTDESDADTSFTDGLPSQTDADILSNIIANESYDDLENLPQTDRRWVAQFGAYQEESEAQERLNAILDLIPDLPGDADISEASNRRVPLYRARLVNMSKEQAEAVCKKMRTQDIACLPLKNR